mmetsp:Transcript_52453/g.118451  ORF Transcript_52453/g.118451 Transcript_52453/m.118451 type:complete len:203 (+) Transcript_52453:1221-1829(+)
MTTLRSSSHSASCHRYNSTFPSFLQQSARLRTFVKWPVETMRSIRASAWKQSKSVAYGPEAAAPADAALDDGLAGFWVEVVQAWRASCFGRCTSDSSMLSNFPAEETAVKKLTPLMSVLNGSAPVPPLVALVGPLPLPTAVLSALPLALGLHVGFEEPTSLEWRELGPTVVEDVAGEGFCGAMLVDACTAPRSMGFDQGDRQ